MRAASCCAALLAIGLGACESATGPGDADVVLEVLGTVPDLEGSGFFVEYRVRNDGSALARIEPRCGPALNPLVHARQGDRWESVGGGFCLAIHDMSPWPLGRGESVEGLVWWRDEGTFRLEVRAWDSGMEESVSVTSESFRLER